MTNVTEMTNVTLKDIEEARTAMREDREHEDGDVRPPIAHTPCIRAPWLEALALERWGEKRQEGFEVRLKLETQQETASFKQRGAFNKLRCLRREHGEVKALRVYTASAGNHAQGVARHTRDFNAFATIVMPTSTPKVKVDNTKRLLEGGRGEVVQSGKNYDESRQGA